MHLASMQDVTYLGKWVGTQSNPTPHPKVSTPNYGQKPLFFCFHLWTWSSFHFALPPSPLVCHPPCTAGPHLLKNSGAITDKVWSHFSQQQALSGVGVRRREKWRESSLHFPYFAPPFPRELARMLTLHLLWAQSPFYTLITFFKPKWLGFCFFVCGCFFILKHFCFSLKTLPFYPPSLLLL